MQNSARMWVCSRKFLMTLKVSINLILWLSVRAQYNQREVRKISCRYYLKKYPNQAPLKRRKEKLKHHDKFLNLKTKFTDARNVTKLSQSHKSLEDTNLKRIQVSQIVSTTNREWESFVSTAAKSLLKPKLSLWPGLENRSSNKI